MLRTLCHKAWVDTRIRFVFGLVLAVIPACGLVLWFKPDTVITAPPMTYPEFIDWQFFSQQLAQIWCLMTVLLGIGGLNTQPQLGGGALFTLSLPVSRGQILTSRAIVVLLELLAIAIVPALAIVVLSPLNGHSYSLGAALGHAGLLWTGGAVFYAAAFLLAHAFRQPLAPILVLGFFLTVMGLRAVFPGLTAYTLAPVVTGQIYFRDHVFPWTHLLVSVALSALFFSLAGRVAARRDF